MQVAGIEPSALALKAHWIVSRVLWLHFLFDTHTGADAGPRSGGKALASVCVCSEPNVRINIQFHFFLQLNSDLICCWRQLNLDYSSLSQRKGWTGSLTQSHSLTILVRVEAAKGQVKMKIQ